MLYLSHPSGLEHDPQAHMPGHPDTPERLRAIERVLEGRDWLGWERRQAPPAEARELELVHSARHIETIRELCLSGGGSIDADTFVPRCMPPGEPARWPGPCWAERIGSASAPCAPPATTPNRSGQWASVCSTTSRSRPS
jgi:hypothetical protein